MAPPGGRHGGYNDIPESDDMDGDDYSSDGENPFAAATGNGRNGRRTGGGRKTAAIRAGGALEDGGHAGDRGAYADDDDLDDLGDFEEQSSSSRRRNRRSGHRRMDVQTLGSLQNRGGNDVRGSMTKCWLYCGLAMLAVMGVLLGILKESRVEKHMAAGVGVEGYARPEQGNNDDDDGRHWHDEQDAEEHQPEEVTNAASPSASAGPRPSTGGASAVPMKPAKKEPHHRDPAATFRSHDPFHLTNAPWYGSVFAPPPFPAYANAHAANDGHDEEEDSFSAGIGYFQSPSIHNDTLLFVSEGDLYLTQIPSSMAIDNQDDGPLVPLPSVKLTTTVGNVLTPHINPVYPYLVAYTGTYTGTREAYLLDLRPSSARGFGPAGPATRLTYFDGVYGVEHVVGWDDDGTSLVVATMHDEVGIENMRLYRIGIVQNGTKTKKGRGLSSHPQDGTPITVSSVDAVPLHQAIDGVTTKSADGESKCIFFTRFKQSSSTFRYVGGTAEHLWAWCEGEDRAVALTADYRGTSKSPGIYHVGSGGEGGDSGAASYLLYISDRFEAEDGTWIPGTLNLWAVPLPSQDELYSDANSGADAKANHIPKKLRRPFPLTSVNCDFNGMSLMEYSIDNVTGNIILRIGADLHLVERKEVVDLLEIGGRRRLDDEEAVDDDDDDDDEGEEKSAETEGADKKETKKKKAKAKEGADSSVASAAAVPKAAKDKSVSSSHLGAKRLPIFIMSDLQNLQERLLPITHPTYAKLLNGIDAYKTPYGTMSALITIRGQAWINPVIPDLESFYEFEGGAMNLPPRRYRVVPGSTTGGMTRVMQALHVPQPEKFSRTSLIVATDPLSPTAELAFYLIETLADSTPAFSEIDDLPRPILGGHVNGGSVQDGGLGSIKDDGVVVSPCGRRVAWTDTDGRICAMALPDLGAYWSANSTEFEAADPLSYTVLPQENENGEPLLGIDAELTWSPGGRYLAIEHAARNQFSIISIADLGEIGEKEEKTASSSSNDAPQSSEDESKINGDWNINLGRIVQATPDRFNSGDVFWGRTAFDMAIEDALGVPGSSRILPTATTLYYLTDRDVMLSDVSSPWGTRAPSPHFKKDKCVYALPLVTDEDEGEGGGDDEDDEDDDVNLIKKMFGGPYSGGGASELAMLRETALEEIEAAKEAEEADEEEGQDAIVPITLSGDNSTAITNGTLSEGGSSMPPVPSLYPTDVDISFGPKADVSLSFARRAYRMSNIPKASYSTIVSQLKDDTALILMEDGDDGPIVKVFSIDDFPSDGVDPMPVDLPGMEVTSAGLSTSRHHLYFIYKLPGKYRTKIIGNDAGSVVSMLIKDDSFTKNIVDNVQWALSIWPSLEYQQMYADAWRLLRDYYYDAGMTDINWREVYARYLPLVGRAAKREELDDVLRQMVSELSALHVFVYGGEYNSPLHEDVSLEMANEVSSLGATLRRSVEWAGYVVTSIPERDQDFALMDGKAIYSPLSEDTLRMSGQRGLEVGDVIIGVNGESVMNVPSIHMLLRGMAGKSVRLEVLRVKSGPSPLLTRRRKRQLDAANDASEAKDNGDDEATPEPLIAVPLSPSDAAHLRYTAWEWRTRNAVKDLSRKAGFTAGYIHLRDMSGGKAADAFVRGFYPDYDKQALIVDVRANHGGNIDSWLLDVLQRRAWMYWQGRATNITNGGLGWDEQFAFRGHVVVLINEKTSSDGEGFSRGISELGLGKLVGTRTWGGGIWLSSDNHLVDGGIATAPEIGTYNKNFGWGLGIENMGVEPDIWVDNDPHETYGGRDAQLEKAIEVLKDWLEEEPVVLPQSPGRHRDMSLRGEAKRCSA